jgi:3,4-dihydroxy-2-butanone 4-phosphate synthase
VHGELGHVYLMTHRAHGAICVFLLEQVSNQLHFDAAVDDSPCAFKSAQALAIPCGRSSLSSVMRSRMANLLGDAAQVVVACRVGQWGFFEL